VLAVLLAGVGSVAYVATGAALLDEIDTGLRFRAAAAVADPGAVPGTGVARRFDEEPGESLEQVLSPAGAVLMPGAGSPRPLLDAASVRGVSEPRYFVRRVPGTPGRARLLATPVRLSSRPAVLVVGATMTDRSDALAKLVDVLTVGGAIALLVASGAGWVVGGWALRPVERMRREAAAITASGLDHRLSAPPARDEIHRLAGTLNDMLSRLERSAAGERAFLARASHELRTPLAALRAELELARARPRRPEELVAALDSAAEETERLVRLSEDLLVLARSGTDGLPLRRERVELRDIVVPVATRFAATATVAGVELTTEIGSGTVHVDRARLDQALTNLVANAITATPRGGRVTVRARADGSSLVLDVADTGPGFPPGGRSGGGLGLRVVRAVVTAHGGDVRIGGTAGNGATVTVAIPDAVTADDLAPHASIAP
jgi:signal transduction histidine kinase